jgi:hypothetical protein
MRFVYSEQKERERDFVPLSGVSAPLGDDEFRVLEPGPGGGEVAVEPSVEILQ